MAMATADDPPPDEPSYIDYESFLSPSFCPSAFANALVVSTNNPGDLPLDLSTPLSRVLFDAQEVDSHIHRIATRDAVPILRHTQDRAVASERILAALDAQLAALNESYHQLEREVTDKHAEAEEVRQVTLRLWETLRLARAVARCLQLGRQLEVQRTELGGPAIDDHGALVRCSYTILYVRDLLDSKAPGQEGHGLARVDAVRRLQDVVLVPAERSVRESAERIVREFSVPAAMTFSQGEDARSRLISALAALYLLSPTTAASASVATGSWQPRLLLQALETYVRSALQASITSLARALGQLPSLERALADVVSRCQNVVSLELVLESAKPPSHPFLSPSTPQQRTHDLRQPLLSHLETSSLASYFWRTMASSLASRVQDIVSRGGVVARTLRSNRTQVCDAIRHAVSKGSQPPSAMSSTLNAKTMLERSWDREIAVMVGSVANNLGR